jgi:hypothetical protein
MSRFARLISAAPTLVWLFVAGLALGCLIALR